MKKILLLITAILILINPVFAADVKISALPAVTSTTPATDVIPLIASGVTSKITVANLLSGYVTGSGTIHYWPYWTGTSTLGSKAITASKPICSDASGDPGVCAGTEGVWQVAGSYQPLNTKLSAIGTLANGAGVLTNDGSGNFSYTSGGYTNLTSFIDQTAWRLFYSDGSGDVKELVLGSNGTYLKSNGASSAPTFDNPGSGSGTVTSSGTPTIHQWPVWTTDTDIKGVGVTASSLVGTDANGEPIAVTQARLDDSAAQFCNVSDPTKCFLLNAGNIATGTIRTYNAPDVDGNIALGGSGATLPTTCQEGQSYMLDMTGRKILYICKGSNTWEALQSFATSNTYPNSGTMIMCVNKTSGTDDTAHGMGTTVTSGALTSGGSYAILNFAAGDDFSNVGGQNYSGGTFVASGTTPTDYTHGSTLLKMDANCFATLQYAVNTIPPVNNEYVNIYVNGEALGEAVSITGKNVPLGIKIYGTFSPVALRTLSNKDHTSGAAQAHCTSAGMTASAYNNMMLWDYTDNTYRVIDSNTTSYITLAGYVVSTDYSTAMVYNWATTTSSISVGSAQLTSVSIYNISLAAFTLSGGATTLTNCTQTAGAFTANILTKLTLTDCMLSPSALTINFGTLTSTRGKYAGSGNLVLCQNSSYCYLANPVIDGVTAGSNIGLYASTSFITINNTYSWIRNLNIGIYATMGGRVVKTLNAQYAGNGTNVSCEATTNASACTDTTFFDTVQP